LLLYVDVEAARVVNTNSLLWEIMFVVVWGFCVCLSLFTNPARSKEANPFATTFETLSKSKMEAKLKKKKASGGVAVDALPPPPPPKNPAPKPAMKKEPQPKAPTAGPKAAGKKPRKPKVEGIDDDKVFSRRERNRVAAVRSLRTPFLTMLSFHFVER
jgi:type IV secretory pathway VirB10-like protein